ncbi:HPP family protein [Deinococcus oregonensis]|uniref:HPP family protein n=1 Tax=Deinococcus oregonensis TaxID=1805970 RepID=A0ABV6B939_9DEIO
MKVRDQMTRNIVTVSPQTSLGEARHLLEATHLRCLPVVTAGRLVGLLLQSDPRLVSARADTPVQEMMAPATVSIGPKARIEQAARLMLEHDIRGLPVVDQEGILLGVLTTTDLLAVMVKVPPVSIWY